jgi:hypothetical protein
MSIAESSTINPPPPPSEEPIQTPQWLLDWYSQSPLPETWPDSIIDYYRKSNGCLPLGPGIEGIPDDLNGPNTSFVLFEHESSYLFEHGRLPPDSTRLVDLVGNRIPENRLSVSPRQGIPRRNDKLTDEYRRRVWLGFVRKRETMDRVERRHIVS